MKRCGSIIVGSALVAVLAGCATKGDLDAMEKRLDARIASVEQQAQAAADKAAAAQAAADRAAQAAQQSAGAADQAARKSEAIFEKGVRK